jgi:hypothetical protein
MRRAFGFVFRSGRIKAKRADLRRRRRRAVVEGRGAGAGAGARSARRGCDRLGVRPDCPDNVIKISLVIIAIQILQK